MKEVKELLKNNGEVILALILVSGVLVILTGCVLLAEIVKTFSNCG